MPRPRPGSSYATVEMYILPGGSCNTSMSKGYTKTFPSHEENCDMQCTRDATILLIELLPSEAMHQRILYCDISDTTNHSTDI